jgi:hypothetical protein
MLLGRDLIGLQAVLGVGGVVWTAGTRTGLVIRSAGIPFRMITSHNHEQAVALADTVYPPMANMIRINK